MGSYAQTCKTLRGSPVRLDSLPIEPGSIKVFPDIPFVFNDSTGEITFEDLTDSIRVCYYRLNPILLDPAFNRDISTYVAGRLSAQKPGLTKSAAQDMFNLEGFDSYGSITRGVGFGNRQNVFVNSALNLQMDGQLSDNLYVTASITDQNIPYQPEGNTQQVRDFDNVFIKLYNDAFDLTVGDIVFTNPVKDAHFLKYYKNVQGLQVNNTSRLNKSWTAKSTASGSAAKGQFATIQMEPIEGVQGPYRLTGPGNEQFLIILANSEHVFIDGEELQRGFDRDYVIDYNLAEITFSPGILITRFTRIRVDFEYSDQYYGRSNFNFTEQFSNEKNTFFLSFYQERDNPNATLGFTLEEQDFQDLATSGDTSPALISGVDSVGYLDQGIFYARKDTLIGGVAYRIYEYSTDPATASYQVSFTHVGDGSGSYSISASTSNGRVYEWVGPGNGSFEPVKRIPAPNKRQMTVVGGTQAITKFESVSEELACSVLDRNLFSDLQDGDNKGLAGKVSIKSAGRRLGNYQFSGLASYEQLTASFSAIDRFRSVEYDRNWGYNVFSDTVSSREDRILTTNVLLQKDPQNLAEGNFSYRNRNGVVAGTQSDLRVAKEIGPLWIKSAIFYMENDPGILKNTWARSLYELRINTHVLDPGYVLTRDDQQAAMGDSIVSTLMHYTAHDFYIQSGDSLKATSFRADYIRREDHRPVSGQLRDYTQAEELRMTSRNRFLDQQVNLIAIYRQVEDLFLKKNEHNVLGRLDWSGSFLQKSIQNSVIYSTASTRELRREYVFIPVQTGQGTHTWRDENADGIQDLNEFYEAINADEKNYIKVFTPTSEYQNAFQSTIQHNLDIVLPEGLSGMLGPLSKVSLNTNTSINQKTTDSEVWKQLAPFAVGLRNPEVLSAKNYQRYSVFYNRNGDGFACDLKYAVTAGKSLLATGYELQKRQEWQSTARIPLGRELSLRFQNLWGNSTNESDFLDSRNFRLDRRTWSPQLVFQPGTEFRIISKMERRVRETTGQEDPDFSRITDFSVETTWARSTKGNLNATLQWLTIKFNGEVNSYLGYELLEGLRPGQNQRWNVNWQQSLGRGLQLTLQYIGRKSPDAAAVHTGNMQLTAYF